MQTSLTLASNPAQNTDWFRYSKLLMIRDEDIQTVAITFVTTGLVVLLASIIVDAAMSAVVINGVSSLDMIAARRLAGDLLPICLLFTALVAFFTGVAVIYAKGQLHSMKDRPTASTHRSQIANAQRLGFA